MNGWSQPRLASEWLNWDIAVARQMRELSAMPAILTTSRIELDPVQSEHWEDYAPILSAPATSRYSDLPRNPSKKRCQGFVNWMIRIGAQRKGAAWMMRVHENGQLFGCIRLNSIDWKQSVAVVGYELAEAYWGKGLATEALTEVVRHCHADLNVHRLEAWTLEGNARSDRVLERAGFRHEGRQREKMLLGGERYLMNFFGRLAGD